MLWILGNVTGVSIGIVTIQTILRIVGMGGVVDYPESLLLIVMTGVRSGKPHSVALLRSRQKNR